MNLNRVFHHQDQEEIIEITEITDFAKTKADKKAETKAEVIAEATAEIEKDEEDDDLII